MAFFYFPVKVCRSIIFPASEEALGADCCIMFAKVVLDGKSAHFAGNHSGRCGRTGCRHGAAHAVDIWFSPTTDDATQGGPVFPQLYDYPDSWIHTIQQSKTFSVPAHYIMATPPEIVRQQFQFLRAHNIHVDVAVPGISADKNKCGSDIEGVMWHGEAALNAERLRNLGIEVDTFSFDLPLNAGYLQKGGHPCGLTLIEAAKNLAESAAEIRKYYPNARFVDQEVPTGMPVAEWATLLRQWIAAYRAASGENFYGLTMDAWWGFPWQDTARQTAAILHENGIRAGMFFDADGKPGMTAQQFRTDAEHNVCAVRAAAIPLDYVVVANWMVMTVKNLPESDPLTLTSFLDWVAAGTGCPSP